MKQNNCTVFHRVSEKKKRGKKKMEDERVDASTHLNRMKRLTHNYVEGGQGSVFMFSALSNAFCRVVPTPFHERDDGTHSRYFKIKCGSNKLPLTAKQQVERLETLLTRDPLKFGDKYSFHISNRYNDTNNMTKNGDKLKNVSHGIHGRNHQHCSIRTLHTEKKIIPFHEVVCNVPESLASSNVKGAFHLRSVRGSENEYSFHATGELSKSKDCFVEKSGELACNRHKECRNPFGCEVTEEQSKFLRLYEAKLVEKDGRSKVQLVPWKHF